MILPTFRRPEAVGSTVPAAMTEPAADVVADLSEGIGASRRDQLANALHQRWHGDHTPEAGKTECARASGAFDDVAAIEPILLDMLRRRS